MNCEQVQSLLLAYLDGEVTPSERLLILAHLSGCTVCQQELDLLSTARSQVRAALQRRAVQAVPSREAWSRLEAGLTEAAQPSSRLATWFSRKAPRASRAFNQLFGGVTMQKRWIFSGLAGVVALLVLAIVVAQTATPVSAREILDRAYDAQSAQTEGEGIQHMRVETYHNLCARPEGQGTIAATVMESYLDLQAGYFRTIITESGTGKVREVFAHDGTYTYSGSRSVEVKSEIPEKGTGEGRQNVCDQPLENTDDILTVYRGMQDKIAGVNFPMSEGVRTYEEIFQEMRDNPDAELLGEETWTDGRAVYVLRSHQPVKAIVDGEKLEPPMGWVTSYFDTESYKLVESRATLERDGEELLIYSYRVLADEILPSGSAVAWDLSDLQGITVVDDPEGQQVDLLPEVISPEELAQTPSAYLLNSIPEGFTLEISAAPKQPVDQPFFYVASYRNAAGDYFVIQSIGPKEVKFVEGGTDETYTTASGSILTFMEDVKNPSNKQFISAVLETPEGVAFFISSTLPREQVKALAEDLILVSK